MNKLIAIVMLLMFIVSPWISFDVCAQSQNNDNTVTEQSETIRSAVREYLKEKDAEELARKERTRKIVLNVGKGIAIIIALLVLRAIIKAIGRGTRKDDPDAPTGVYITAETEDDAKGIAKALIEEHLATDAKIIPNVRSIYTWEGKTEDASETLLLLKTVQLRVAPLIARAEELHKYAVPDIVALPIYKTHTDFADWVREPGA
jgi:periplasmic divalent cation tolerance protein